MKILIIGGTYFLGKAFLKLADDGARRITVLNRGNRSVPGNEDGHVKVLLADRTKPEELGKLSWDPEGYDVIVDFCAYQAGDVKNILEALPRGIRQYVLISTCDVYRRGSGGILAEDAPFETRDFGGEAGSYILGKTALERELLECASGRGMHYTVIRPAVIYGPGNYAPREGIFFHWARNAGQILFPENADGSFQVTYVEDAARFLLDCLLNEKAMDEAFNLCGEPITYEDFANALDEAVGMPLQRISISVEDAMERGIPFPFPLMKEESETYDGTKAVRQGLMTTPLEEGLQRAWEWFLSEGE